MAKILISKHSTPFVKPLGLYIHIPFCRKKCHYCAFISAPPESDQQIDSYCEAVKHHLAITAPLASNRVVTSIYIGGGTPSLLGSTRLESLLNTLHSSYNISPDAEITVEINPESATLVLFESLIKNHVNRISIGAQSFFNERLLQLGRIHNKEKITECCHLARSAGFTNISLDLLIGIPGQSIEEWKETILCAMNCYPAHISAYDLKLEEGTKLFQWVNQRKMPPLLEDVSIEMYHLMQDSMAQKGWNHYEISNWCQPGKESRHNLLYWDREDYLAFGVSAYGFYNETLYGFIINSDTYSGIMKGKNLKEELIPHVELAEEFKILTPDEAASDSMIFGLRKLSGISMERYKERFGYTPLERWGNVIEMLINDKQLEIQDDFLRLTPDAILISNEILYHFLD